MRRIGSGPIRTIDNTITDSGVADLTVAARTATLVAMALLLSLVAVSCAEDQPSGCSPGRGPPAVVAQPFATARIWTSTPARPGVGSTLPVTCRSPSRVVWNVYGPAGSSSV